MSLTSTDVAAFLDADHHGPPTTISGVDSLDSAGPEDLAFCIYDDPAYIRESDAGTIICPPSVSPIDGRTLIVSREPKLAFVNVAHEYFMADREGTAIHPTAVVEKDATVGERTVIGPHAHVKCCVEIGDGCTIRSGAVLGTAGFGFERGDAGQLHRQIHQGCVRIENDVEIGPNTSIDRAVFDETVIERGAKLSGQVHVAHQVWIGADTTVAYNSGFAGGANIGERVTIHPGVAVATDIEIGDDAEIGMNAGVLEDVPPETTVGGTPAHPIDNS